jgi:SRSO17 transposase
MIATGIAKPTVGFVDDYYDYDRDLFVDMRSFEAFKHLHLAMMSEAKRKPLPAMATVIGWPNAQSLPQFWVNSHWRVKALSQDQSKMPSAKEFAVAR